MLSCALKSQHKTASPVYPGLMEAATQEKTVTCNLYDEWSRISERERRMIDAQSCE